MSLQVNVLCQILVEIEVRSFQVKVFVVQVTEVVMVMAKVMGMGMAKVMGMVMGMVMAKVMGMVMGMV